MKMLLSSPHRFVPIIFFSIFLATPISAYGLEAGKEPPQEPPVSAKLKEPPLSWNELREVHLLKVKEDREISKNVRDTRRFVEQTRSNRSRLGQAILSEGSWLRTETEHFYIFHKEGDKDAATALASGAENALTRAKAVLGNMVADWPERAEVILFRDEKFWQNTERTNTFHPNSFSFPDQLEIYIQPGNADDIKTVEAHHIAHLLLGYYIEIEIRAGSPIPAWLGEGLAEQICCQEKNQKRYKELIASGEALSITRLLTTNAPPYKKKAAEIFQAETSELIGFILKTIGEKGFHGFVDLLFTSGVPYAYATDTFPTAERARLAFEFLIQNTALQEKYPTLEDFEKAWKSSFRD